VPHSLSRGLVLVEWWRLALPHYLVEASSSAARLGCVGRCPQLDVDIRGLVSVLVLFAGIVLSYRPKSLNDFDSG